MMKRSLLQTLIPCTAALLLTACTGYESYDDASVSSRSSSRGQASRGPASERVDGLVLQELRNCDAEILRLQHRLDHLEGTLETVLADDSIKSVASSSEARTASVRADLDKLEGDLASMKQMFNDTAKALNTALTKVNSIDASQDKQEHNIENLETALRSLTDAVRSTNSSFGGAVDMAHTTGYKVQSGDSLGKIAHEHNTSIQTLMELNGLARDDLIIIGQQLRVPSDTATR